MILAAQLSVLDRAADAGRVEFSAAWKDIIESFAGTYGKSPCRNACEKRGQVNILRNQGAGRLSNNGGRTQVSRLSAAQDGCWALLLVDGMAAAMSATGKLYHPRANWKRAAGACLSLFGSSFLVF